MTIPDPLAAMKSDGMVPIHTSDRVDQLHSLAISLVQAGISTLEVTLRAPGSLDALRTLLARIRDDDLPLAIGAGTVVDAASADAVIGAGARFVFSPMVSAAIARRCQDAGVTHIPGCATPTEIHRALELGCQAVKLFPADSIGGPDFLRAVRSVFPDVGYIPSGGIVPNAAKLKPWFEAGAVAVAMGSQLLGKAPFEGAEVPGRLEAAKTAVALAREEST